jgi:hypothetical protein
MRMQRHSGTANAIAHREAAVITAMMDDLRRIVEILDFDVAPRRSERAFSTDRMPCIRSWRGHWPPGGITSS